MSSYERGDLSIFLIFPIIWKTEKLSILGLQLSAKNNAFKN